MFPDIKSSTEIAEKFGFRLITMSIFIALLSFSDSAHQTEVKFAILVASSVLQPFTMLSLYNKKKNKQTAPSN